MKLSIFCAHFAPSTQRSCTEINGEAWDFKDTVFDTQFCKNEQYSRTFPWTFRLFYSIFLCFQQSGWQCVTWNVMLIMINSSTGHPEPSLTHKLLFSTSFPVTETIDLKKFDEYCCPGSLVSPNEYHTSVFNHFACHQNAIFFFSSVIYCHLNLSFLMMSFGLNAIEKTISDDIVCQPS